MKKIFGALVACLISGAAFGQAQLGPGHVWGNSTAAKAPPQDATVTAILDRALGSTRGAIIERGASGWAMFTPSATARVPYLSGGAGADPLYGAYTLPASVTSGGVACFTSTTAQGSSVLLTLNGLLLGGGAGACPTPMASLGTTTTLLHGNAAGAPTFSAVSLTADVSGQLPFGNGGCNGTTQQSCFDNAAPTATRAGDIIYWNGTHYVTLAGNNSGNQILQESSAGVPSWIVAGTGTVTSLTCSSNLLCTGANPITTSGTIDLSANRKTLSSGCAINATVTATCADGTAGANNGTYTTPTGALWLEIEGIGGGGGGCGSGTTPGAAGTGTATTFGTGPLLSSGTATACSTSNHGTGGTSSGGFVNKIGGSGGDGSGAANTPGGGGCVGPYGGGGAFGALGGGVGGAASNNSGSGGGGAGAAATLPGGGGGACGGFFRAIIQSPNATYSYAIGGGGIGGTLGTGGAAGGAGGTGYLQIIPHFN